jgi:hypothetical protein
MFQYVKMTEVLNSFNIFIDTQSGLSGRTDDVTIQVGTAGLTLGDGQIFRMYVEQFNMYRNFYNVHGNNALFRISSTGASVSDDLRLGELAHQNTKTIGDNVSLFKDALCVTALASAIAVGSTATTCTGTFTPANTVLMDDNGTRQFTITLTFNAVHTFTKFNVQSFTGDGDHFLMFGGNKITQATPTNTTTSSYAVTFPTTSTVLIKGYYSCQRSTDAFVYVRSDLANNGIESSSFSSATANHTSQITNSDIICRVPIDYEFCYFSSQTGSEFMLNLTNRNINTMRFSLRDSKDRLFGRRTGNTSTDFSGAGTAQNSTGNLNFTMILRLEQIQQYVPRYLNLPAPEKKIPTRLESVVLSNLGAPSPL